MATDGPATVARRETVRCGGRRPRPAGDSPTERSEPTNSPMIAPTVASVIATFSPVNTCGKACGSRTLTNAGHGRRPMDRMRCSTSRSSERNPAMESITIGKNDRRNVMNTFGNRPNPNQMMNSGASAIFGTSWVNTSTGITIRSTEREKATASPQGTLTATARRKPSAISRSVTSACWARSGARTTSSPAVASGVGRM